MYSEIDGSRKAIGDVDVLFHEGLYHLFHLVLPNHDFIAHAVSTDALNWRRVNNALFIGDPGSWDDLMLWTMHVSPDPHQAGCWRMFYTGLSRRDQGNFQRIGLATSLDLYHWTKVPVNWEDHRGPNDPDLVKQAVRLSRATQADSRSAMYDPASCFPLEPCEEFYESSLDVGRQWVSFRDPFFYQEGSNRWLLANGRVKDGPVVRRGCVALLNETSPNHFKCAANLHHPRLYDDVEVPNLLKFDDEYFLIGSIREDAKIRYWHTSEIGKPWQSYHDNVLLAQGNYAGRICRDDRGYLLWCFYSMAIGDRKANNIMPPPKRLVRTKSGLLRAVSFEGIEQYVRDRYEPSGLRRLIADAKSTQVVEIVDGQAELSSDDGFEVFAFDANLEHVRFSCQLQSQGFGKCGIVFRLDGETRDGYYLSLDLLKGVAQLRSWGTGEKGSREQMMQFKTLQSAFWYSADRGRVDILLIAFGSYLEVSIDGRVVLCLVNQEFTTGQLGLYLESASVTLSRISIYRLHAPSQTDEHLVKG